MYEAVEVNQRALVDKILSRYPEEFTVFRELLQNADDAGAKNFVIDFRTLRHASVCASNETKLDLDSVKVSKWLVKNDGATFKKDDWSRLTNIAEGNQDTQKIGAFGVGFYSVFRFTDEPIVKSNGKMMTVFYKDGENKLFAKSEECSDDKWTVIELKLKQESAIPRTFELTRFLVTSMTFLSNIQHVTISLDDAPLSTIAKSRCGPDQPIPVPDYMIKTSPERTMSINSVSFMSQEIKVTFVETSVVGALKRPIDRMCFGGNERKPTESLALFTKTEEKLTSITVAAPIYTGTTSKTPSLETGAEFSAKYCIYAANVTVSVKGELKKGLEHAMKKKSPKEFSFQMVFFSKEEHDKQTQEDNNSKFRNVFCGPQGLCPPTQGENAARIFIGQSTAQTAGMACHMSGHFIPTVERGSIDLTNGHVAKWNKELLYVGGFLARMAYDSEMNKLYSAWSTLEKTSATSEELALYMIKSFTFHPSTPDPKVSNIIKDAFFHCSKTSDFQMISDRGIRNTKDIRQYHADFAPFMQGTPVLPDEIRDEILSMIKSLPDKLQVRTYAFGDVVDELKSRCLTESEMAACLRWWINTFGSRGPLSEKHRKYRDELQNAGRAVSGRREIELKVIRKFVDGRTLKVLDREDPLPEDTIPPALIEGLVDSSRIQYALGWQEMPIAHWLRHVRNSPLDNAHDITRSSTFAYHVLTVLGTLWNSLPDDSRFEIRDILENVACIPTGSPARPSMHRPKEAYFPQADVFRDLPVVRQDIISDRTVDVVLKYLGVQKRCDIDTFIKKASDGNRWNAMDLARYLMESMEHAGHVMSLEIFPCNDGVRRHIRQIFASTEINRELGLDVVNCDNWDASHEAQFLVQFGLREHPTIEELIHIASSASNPTRRRSIAFQHLCGQVYEARLEKEFDPSKFSSCAFIPSIRSGIEDFIPHEEVVSEPSWALFGFGKVSDKKVIQKLKIRDRPTAAKLIEILESNPPKNARTATQWFQFLADKGVFSAGDFTKIAGLKIVPVPKSTSEPQESEMVSPRDCFLKSKSEAENPENPFYQRLFKFIDFGQKANSFLRACGVKDRPEGIDILKSLLHCPQEFYRIAEMAPEKYMAELRMIAVGYKSLPRSLLEEMRKAQIFLGCRRRKVLEGKDEYKLCKAEEVLVADDMESCRTFGDYIFIAPQEELLEKFYSEMRVKSLSSCIAYTVNATKESRSPNADQLRQSIIQKIPIFLYEFDDQRFRQGMRLLRWHDETQFCVRACAQLRVTKKLEFEHATELQARPHYDTDLTAETEVKNDIKVLWIKEPKADSYDIAAALCRLLFSTYKKNDVLSLMSILDTPIDVLERRGYDVDRILKEYEAKLYKGEQCQTNCSIYQGQTVAPRPTGEPAPSKARVPRKLRKWLPWLRNDPQLGKVKMSDIGASIEKVKEVMKEAGGKDDKHISNREEVGGGKKQKNVGYCDEKKVAENDLEECDKMKQMGQIKVWKLRGTLSDIPIKECEAFVKIISDLAQIFEVNQTRCHVFYHTSDSDLMGFNRNDQVFFGLQHYLEKHKDVPLGEAYVDWYYIMAHELAHVHTPYHDEHHELLFAALTTKYLTRLHGLSEVRQMFKCAA